MHRVASCKFLLRSWTLRLPPKLQGDGKLGQGGADAAGQLQAVLASHLAKCPYAIIHIEAVNSLHIDVLPVLLSALSEQVMPEPERL